MLTKLHQLKFCAYLFYLGDAHYASPAEAFEYITLN